MLSLSKQINTHCRKKSKNLTVTSFKQLLKQVQHDDYAMK